MCVGGGGEEAYVCLRVCVLVCLCGGGRGAWDELCFNCKTIVREEPPCVTTVQ
jgi:hypothetical protein